MIYELVTYIRFRVVLVGLMGRCETSESCVIIIENELGFEVMPTMKFEN